MNKIKYVSFLFRIIFQLSFIAVLGVQIVGWLCVPPMNSFYNVIPASYFPYVTIPLTGSERFVGFLVTLVPVLFELWALGNLSKLFYYFQRHEIFVTRSVRCITNAGYGLLIYQLIQPVFEFILGFVLTAKNPPGFRIAKMTLSDGNIKVILTALIVMMISWVMTEGTKLHEEQQLTI